MGIEYDSQTSLATRLCGWVLIAHQGEAFGLTCNLSRYGCNQCFYGPFDMAFRWDCSVFETPTHCWIRVTSA